MPATRKTSACFATPGRPIGGKVADETKGFDLGSKEGSELFDKCKTGGSAVRKQSVSTFAQSADNSPNLESEHYHSPIIKGTEFEFPRIKGISELRNIDGLSSRSTTLKETTKRRVQEYSPPIDIKALIALQNAANRVVKNSAKKTMMLCQLPKRNDPALTPAARRNNTKWATRKEKITASEGPTPVAQQAAAENFSLESLRAGFMSSRDGCGSDSPAQPETRVTFSPRIEPSRNLQSRALVRGIHSTKDELEGWRKMNNNINSLLDGRETMDERRALQPKPLPAKLEIAKVKAAQPRFLKRRVTLVEKQPTHAWLRLHLSKEQ